jgi:GMP synthase-like glutamine amidotransferase
VSANEDRSVTAGTVGILVTGVLPPHLAERHGAYDAMMGRLIGEGFGTRSYDVRSGELPDRPEDHPAYLITGSSAGVYDDLPWIASLQAFIRAAHGRAKLIGICFGHQVMAEALGGRVEKSPKGWGLGLHSYDIVCALPWMDAEPRLAAVASHQDQVVAAPPGATVLAASPFTPFAALSYAGGRSISLQFHPEFSTDLGADLVELQRPKLPEGAAERAHASLAEASDADRVAGWLRRFIGGSEENGS